MRSMVPRKPAPAEGVRPRPSTVLRSGVPADGTMGGSFAGTEETSMGSSRRLWPVSVVVGVGLGAFSVLADGIIGGRLFGILGNIASPWGLAAFFVGRLTTSPKRGARRRRADAGGGRGRVLRGQRGAWLRRRRGEPRVDDGRVGRRSGHGVERRGDLGRARTPTGPRGGRALGDARGRGDLPRDRPQGLALQPRRRDVSPHRSRRHARAPRRRPGAPAGSSRRTGTGDGSSTWSSRWRAWAEPSRSWCCGS